MLVLTRTKDSTSRASTASASSTAVLMPGAEIVPYARARLTAALEAVPHAPRARWRWVAVHRCPRAIAEAACRALMPKVVDGHQDPRRFGQSRADRAGRSASA